MRTAGVAMGLAAMVLGLAGLHLAGAGWFNMAIVLALSCVSGIGVYVVGKRFMAKEAGPTSSDRKG